MTPDIRDSLHLALLRQLLSLLLLLFQLEAFGGGLKLLLIHHEEVAGSALGKVGLSQDVLHAGDRRNFALVVDVLELVHLVGLIDDPVALLEVDELVFLGVGG